MPTTRRSKNKKALQPREVKEESTSEETSFEGKAKEENVSEEETSSKGTENTAGDKKSSSKRKVKEEVECDETTLKRKEIQSLWKVPAIAQFVSLYRFAFKLPEIEIEDLEDGILEATAVGSKVLLELLVNILKSIQPSKGINADNFEEHLRRITNQLKATGECSNVNLSEDVRFIKLDTESKVDLLYSLCLKRLDRPDVLEAMKDMDAETLRVQPLGCDDLGNEYWYFYGTRLYKQEPSKLRKKDWREEWNDQKNQSLTKRTRGRPKKNSVSKSESEDLNEGKRYMNIDEKSRWSVACNTIEDWVDFAEKLKKSKSKNERALFLTITDNFLPVLNEMYQEKERKLQEKLRELIPVPEPRRIETRRMTRKVTKPDMIFYDDNPPKEHLVRDRASRLEERNRRLSRMEGRSSNRSRRGNGYYDEDDDIFEDFYDVDDGAHTQKVNQRQNSAAEQEVHHFAPLVNSGNDLKSKVLRVLSEVKLHKDSWPFLYPVEESYAPGYYDIIETGMDLQTMSKKLFMNEYRTVNDIDRDFELMVSNCKLYNGEHSDMTKMVMNLWKVFRKGLTKAFGSEQSSEVSEPPAKVQRTSPEYDTQESSYENKYPEPSKKQKKTKSSRKEALESLSKEAELAVEETQKSPDFMQLDTRELGTKSSQYSMYSDLKIVPINSHSSSMIEKYSSDSSNQDDDMESSLDGAPRYLNDDSSAAPPVLVESGNQEPQEQPRRTTPTIHFMSQIGSDFSDLMNKTGPNNDVAQNQEIENELNTSVSTLSSSSPSLSATLGRNSSPNLDFPTVPEQNPPLQQGGYGAINELANFTSSFETSTVNAAALGLPSSKKPAVGSQIPMTTSFGNYSQAPIPSAVVQAPIRPNPELTMPPFVPNQVYQGVQITKESSQTYQAQRSNVTMSFPTSYHPQMSTMVSSGQPSKAYPEPGNVVMQPQGENKYPNLKFSLPPSNGEILLVPSDATNSSMTFHLYAQPTANSSQPIQSSIELKHGNGSIQIPNQQATNPVPNQVLSSNQNREETAIRPQKRKSPVLEPQDAAMQKTPATTSLPYPNTSMVKITDSNAPQTYGTDSSRQPLYARQPNAPPHQRPTVYNVGKSAFQPRTIATTTVPVQQSDNSYPQKTMANFQPRTVVTTARGPMPVQQGGNSYPPRTMASFQPRTVATATGCPVPVQQNDVPYPQNTMASVVMQPGMYTTSASSGMPRPSNVSMKTVQGLLQSGQLIYVQPAGKERRLPGEQQVRMQSLVGKNVAEAVTSSPYLTSANTNVVMQSSTFQNGGVNPSQVYTQVVPSQIQPQFVNNNPYYIIADPNAFQGAQRYPVMNMQPVPFTNR